MIESSGLRYEQSRVDSAYLLAEHKREKLSRQLNRPVEAGNNKAANEVRRRMQDRLAQLESLLRADAGLLVFGRVDFSHNHSDLPGETYYIGKASLLDEPDADPLVIAWESRLAGAFQDPANYEDGRAVARKRTFFGKGRQLTDLTETLYSDGQPQPGGGDPLLEALAGRTSGELGEVVATIRAEQFRLMEHPPDRTLVVQGGPGTGKSIIGLHRVSVILYRSEGQITEGDVLVVGPSDIFIRYVDNVLPELGRAAVRHRSIAQIGTHGVQARQQDVGLTQITKGQRVMADVIGRYLDQRISVPNEPVELWPGTRLPTDAARGIVEQVRAEAGPYMVRRQRLRGLLLRAVSREGDPTPRSEDAIENALNRLMPDRSERRVLQDLLTGRRLLSEAADGLLDAAQQGALLRPTERIEDTHWTIEDLALLDEAAWQLQGLPGIGQQFQHVVVDEAQDLSPMQLRLLQRRVAKSGAMTILGDLAQATSPWAPSSWEDHLAEAGIHAEDFEELTTSYRIPLPLLTFGNRLLDVIDVPTEPAQSVIADGDDPAIIPCADSEDVINQTKDVIDSLIFVGNDDGQVGVIGSETLLAQLSEALEDEGIGHTWAARSLREPVTLIPPHDSKGLEFNHVIVLEPSDLYRSDTAIGPRALYVAMTRARDTLTLVHHYPLPRVLVQRGTPEAGELGEEPTTRPHEPPVARPTSSEKPASSIRAWRWFVRHSGRLVEVHVSDDLRATVVEVPLHGGSAQVVASGAVAIGTDGLAWALTTTRTGRAISVVTGTERGAASDTVVSALEPYR